MFWKMVLIGEKRKKNNTKKEWISSQGISDLFGGKMRNESDTLFAMIMILSSILLMAYALR